MKKKWSKVEFWLNLTQSLDKEICNNLTILQLFLQEFHRCKEQPWLRIWFYCKRHNRGIQRGTLRGKSYPFIMTEGSSVSTQAAELTKRFSGGRAEFFPATFLETTVTTQGAWQQQRKSLKSWYNKPLWLTEIQSEPTPSHRSHILQFSASLRLLV